MATEVRLHATLGRKALSFIAVMLPSFEGAFQLTVIDGKSGQVFFRFHESTREDVDQILSALKKRFPDQVHIQTNRAL